MTETLTRVPDREQSMDGSTRISDRVRVAGTSCFIGGLVWLGGLLASGALGGDDVLAQNRPLFLILEACYLLADVLILVGLVGLWWAGATRSRLGRVGLMLALLGRVAFIAAELVFVVQGGDDLLPVAAIVSTLAMLLVGIATLIEQRWGAWQRFAPLLVGVYPFVAMFPFVILASPNMVAIAGWGACWALLGVAMRTAGGMSAVRATH